MAEEKRPDIQLFCNLVIRSAERGYLFVQYNPDDERWWLPYADLETYQHPDDAVEQALKQFPGLSIKRSEMIQIQSFRGRAGWHITFDYIVECEGEPDFKLPTAWFPIENPPKTVHGKWEIEVIRQVVDKE